MIVELHKVLHFTHKIFYYTVQVSAPPLNGNRMHMWVNICLPAGWKDITSVIVDWTTSWTRPLNVLYGSNQVVCFAVLLTAVWFMLCCLACGCLLTMQRSHWNQDIFQRGWLCGSAQSYRSWRFVVQVLLIAVHGLRVDLWNVSSFIVSSPTPNPWGSSLKTCITDHRFLILYNHSCRLGR